MLSKILEVCKNAPQGTDLDEIARTINKDPIVVEGMVNHLIQMGELVEHPGQIICETCPTRSSCSLLQSPTKVLYIPNDTIQEYNRNCQEYFTPDRGE